VSLYCASHTNKLNTQGWNSFNWFNVVHYSSTFFRSIMVPTLVENFSVLLLYISFLTWMHSRDTTILIDFLGFNVVHLFQYFFRSTTLVENSSVLVFYCYTCLHYKAFINIFKMIWKYFIQCLKFMVVQFCWIFVQICSVPEGECIHIRQCTPTCVTTNMLHLKSH